ncbi:MAG: hypothetical protein IKL89_04745 [Clostridia bacterium]|nr:hypothetical protein [Clostridia bacterium]
MKRISNERIKIVKIVTILFFLLLLLLSVIICFLPDIFPEPKYYELNEKDIVVSKLIISYGRGGSKYRIYTSDGESYYLTGEFEPETVRNTLVNHTNAAIKWSKNRFFLSFDYAEEVRVGERIIVSYNNDDPIPRSPYFLLAGCLIFVDIAYLLLRFWWIKHQKIMNIKRDRRIEKKYGKAE